MSQAYLDAIWAAVPEGAEPEAFAERRAFLLDALAGRPGAVVADVGCGEGAFSAALAAAGMRPVAVDAADEPLRRLRARFPDLGDVRRAHLGAPLPLADGEADAAWAGEVLEHVVDVGAFAAELRRVVRAGGVLAVTTPDHSRRTLLGLALRPRAADEHFHPYADHLRFFTRRTLGAVLRDAGFGRAEVSPRRGRLYATAR